MDKRIIEETPSTEVLNNDWFIKDSPTGGTTKILGSNLKDIISGDVEDAIDKILDSIAPEWSSTSTYGFDAYVIHEGELWRCFKDTGSTVGEFKTSEWIKAVTSGYITHVIDKIADRFVASNPPFMTYRYSVGDMVFYSEPYHDEQLYVCNTDLPQGESTFNPEHWDVVYTVAGLSKYLMDKIAEAGQVDDVQVKTTGDYESVVDENKVAKIDLSNVLIEKSVPNLPQPIASFSDGADAPLKSLTASIVPVQAGSGDPSPTNVRPISGWDEVNVTRTGKNLFDKTMTLENGYIDASGQVVILSQYKHTQLIKIKPNTSYVGSGYLSSGNGYLTTAAYYDKNLTFISQATMNPSAPYSMTTPQNANYLILSGNDPQVDTIQLEEGTTATTYEPYAGTTTTIPFTDSQGNPVEVYGGSVDVVNGSLDENQFCYKVTSDTNITKSGNYFEINNVLPEDATANYQFIASFCKRTETSLAYMVDGEGRFVTDRRYLAVKLPFSTVEDVKTYLTSINAQIVYTLPTSTTLQQQPTSIKSLDGENNVFASTGDVEELEYIANATDVIANLEARVTALENQ